MYRSGLSVLLRPQRAEVKNRCPGVLSFEYGCLLICDYIKLQEGPAAVVLGDFGWRFLFFRMMPSWQKVQIPTRTVAQHLLRRSDICFERIGYYQTEQSRAKIVIGRRPYD